MNELRFFDENVVDHAGNTHIIADVVDAVVAEKKKDQVAAIADMDHTMHSIDWGVLVYYVRLLNQRRWALNSEQFNKIVIPAKYRRLLKAWGEEDDRDDLFRKNSKLLLDIGDDSSKLYPFRRNDSRDEQEKIAINNHFALLMLLLDSKIISFEPDFANHFRNEFLLRTRLMMGSTPSEIVEDTKTAVTIGCSKGHPEQQFELNFDNNIVHDLGLKVTLEQILEALGKGETFEQKQVLDRRVVVVHGVRAALSKIVDLGAGAGIATMNLRGIGRTVVEHDSHYDFLLRQDVAGGSSAGILVGTRLQETPEGLFLPKPDGEVVHGEVKMRKALEMAEKLGRKLFIAMGDSPRTDFDMMLKALENGGIVLVVGPDYETTKKKFLPKFSPHLAKHPEYAERIFYVSTGRAGFVH